MIKFDLLKTIFSPITPIASFIIEETSSLTLSALSSASRIIFVIFLTRAWKSLFLETKSVSEFISTITVPASLDIIDIRPSFASLVDFF